MIRFCSHYLYFILFEYLCIKIFEILIKILYKVSQLSLSGRYFDSFLLKLSSAIRQLMRK